MPNSKKHISYLIDAGLFLLSAMIIYPLAIRSLMALDQGIIFEAGARIKMGQIPFRDFYLPFGITPAYIQALFFGLLGTTWKAYAIHACVINGLTSVIIYKLLKKLTTYPNIILLFVAIFTTCFFYTIPATPYADNHAMFFCLLAIYGFVMAKYTSPIYFVVTPLSLLLAFLSKQNPTGFYLILFVLIFAVNYSFLWKNLKIVVFSFSLVILLCLGLMLLWSYEAFILYYIQMPKNIGSNRLSLFNFNRFRDYFKLSYDGAKYLLYLLPVSIVCAVLIKNNQQKWDNILIGAGLFMISILAAFTTQNQQQNAYSFITLSTFIFMAPLYVYIKSKKMLLTFIWGILLIVVSMLYIPKKYDLVVYRKFNDVQYHYTNEDTTYHKKIGLYHQELYPMGSIADYDSILNFLESSHQNFIWFGDANFMGSIIGNESVMPLIFYHPGLTFTHPSEDSLKMVQFRYSVYNKMKNKQTKYLVIENQTTFMGAEMKDFWPELVSTQKVVRRFGAGKIYEIEPGFYEGLEH